MNGTRRLASRAVVTALCLVGINARRVGAQEAAAGGASQQKYTMAEYNAYQAAAAEKNPAAQIKLLDDFIAKYPNSALLNYIYPLYYNNYFAQKNYPKTIEYADKLIAMGDKVTPGDLYSAYYIRATT